MLRNENLERLECYVTKEDFGYKFGNAVRTAMFLKVRD